MAVLSEGRNSEPIHELSCEQHVKIPMRDGVLLDATIWRPRDPGVYPVIVERVPYELIARCSGYADYFARRGYVFVGQNVRGAFASEGKPGRQTIGEDWDGYDTIEWVGTQPWSTGKVGMVDGSASGFTQYSVASMRPPHLTALFVRESGFDAHRMFFPGGAFKLALALGMALRSRVDPSAEDEAYFQQFLPLKECPPVLEQSAGSGYLNMLSHPDDGPFWWPRQFSRHFGEIDVPIFHLGGWCDMSPTLQLEYFAGIRAQGRSAPCRQSQRALIGPWLHHPLCTYLQNTSDADFGPDAVVDLNALRVRWYDYWLKGIDNGIMDEPPARVFVMGANRWLDLQTWPPEETSYVPLYLRTGGDRGGASLNDGVLSWKASDGDDEGDRFTYDPEHPIPSLVSFPDFGPRDYQAVEHRLLTYTSEPLEREFTLVGPVKAVIFGTSSAPDTDWVVRLCDVQPDGRSLSVCDGILRARYRESLERQVIMQPGQVYRFEVDLQSTAWRFKPGHRLRVHVTSSDFPRYDRNLNTGGALGEESSGGVATNTVFHDAARPSHVVLPVYTGPSAEHIVNTDPTTP